MIGSIQGVLAQNRGTLVEIETAGGVGYELAVPSPVAASLPETGQQVKLLTHLVSREGVMELYGFVDWAQRSLFRRLIGISGVGPRSALALLSVFEPDDFFAAVLAGDDRALTRAQGIGARSAKRIIAELQDSIAASAGELVGSARATAIAALEALSFSTTEASDLVRRALGDKPAADVDDLVRRALKLAGSGKVS